MGKFRGEQIRFMVATDVMGRGIDITNISHIINFDIPTFSDDYVHRVGRTGRMGREGVAYTFVTPEEGNELTRIEQRIDRLLVRDEMKDFVFHKAAEEGPRREAAPTEPSAPAEPEPKREVPAGLRRGPGPRRHRRGL
jgi:ATP-dependent RNA helicase DeaD